MPQLKIEDLNRLHHESETCDNDLFAEMRSNVLLVSGDHYNKKGSRFWSRIRDTKDLSSEQKLRLTKNHIQKITKTYINNITSHAPGVAILPQDEKEVQDQKAAELHNSVWQFLKHRHRFKKKIRQYAQDFIEIGECWVKVFWDPNAGTIVGYRQKQNEDGTLAVDPFGRPIQDETQPVFSGDFVFERVFGFNLRRAPEAKSAEESRYLEVVKMADIEDLKRQVGDDKEKLKFLEEHKDETFKIFDVNKGQWEDSKNQVMVREFYFRPCAEYPNGYFYITTPSGVLFEGELPGGIFPIVGAGFDEVPTSPRCRSIIKQLRPYQAEINRTASKIAEHQITLGDDKILIQNGTKISQGGQLPGIRAIQYTGMTPQILSGRTGEQYLNYMQSQIKEMYEVANVYEDSEETQHQLEPYTLLFRSLRNKKKFSLYAEKFEQFLLDLVEVTLKLSKLYLSEYLLIPAVGKREYINVSEFKKADELGFQIKLEPQTDDIETKMGKQLSLTHVLQYVGNQLGKDDIGKIMRNMPYVNSDEAFSDLTIDYDNATNDILALDRGEYPEVNQHDNHVYMIKRLTNRMKQSDFGMLDPRIQELYQRKLSEHEQAEAINQQKLLAAKADMIPTGGYLVVCDFYVQDPKDPLKTRRARLPYEALNWLIKRLEQQGSSLGALENLQSSAQAGIAEKFSALSGNASLSAMNPRPELAQLMTGAQASALGGM